MFLVIGLGNPGKEYENTRHNVGFMIADAIRRQHDFTGTKSKFQSEISEGSVNGHKVLLQKPLTYMNVSGTAVEKIVHFYKIPLENIIVFHDDLDLALGKIRIKTGGSAGGHNGLKDIDMCLGKEYKRIRIGIGHPGNKNMVSDYVLQKFSKDEFSIIDEIVEDAGKHIELLLKGNNDLFMTKVAKPVAVTPPPAP